MVFAQPVLTSNRLVQSKSIDGDEGLSEECNVRAKENKTKTIKAVLDCLLEIRIKVLYHFFRFFQKRNAKRLHYERNQPKKEWPFHARWKELFGAELIRGKKEGSNGMI